MTEDTGVDSAAFSALITRKDCTCPICGEKYNSMDYEGLVISFPEYSGTYCLKCWAKWLSEHIPKCIPVVEEKEEIDNVSRTITT